MEDASIVWLLALWQLLLLTLSKGFEAEVLSSGCHSAPSQTAACSGA